MRTVNLAGEPLPRSLADRLYATGTVERVWNLYGPSEDTTYSTFARVPRTASAPPAIGRPLAATRAYVVAEDGEAQPVSVPGELYLGGAGLARGYLHRPDLTAERFLPDPFAVEPGVRLYRTGDRVRWTAAGELEFLGRLDHQVKIRGFRIELGEIEAVLRALPGVREAVVARPRGRIDGSVESPGDRRLVAYVAGDAARRRAAALPARAAAGATWCRPPSWRSPRCPSLPTARWTGRPCRRRNGGALPRRTRRRGRRSKRSSPASGPKCSAPSVWGWPTTSSSWGATRCWPPG